jgi:Histidine phosphatase superfamily (branch 2)
LSFLNTWKYELGAEILVPNGRQELFANGVLHYYNYGRLYDPATKIVARTTSEDRMLKSAENFLAGFFGLDWTQNATLEVIVESPGFNNSLVAFDSCNNSVGAVNTGGSNASDIWIAMYLGNATQRLQSMVTGLNWTLADTYAAQTLCSYETVRIQPLYPFMTKYFSSDLSGLQCLLSPLHVPGI